MKGWIVIAGTVVLLLMIVVWQFVKVSSLVKRTDVTVQPFQKNIPNARINMLFLGDSTSVGVGALHPEESVAGLFAKGYPDASVESISVTGLRLAGLREKLSMIKRQKYDLIVIQIGANDIIHLTPMVNIRRDIQWILDDVTKKSKRVVFLHSGNVGKAPIFIPPFSWILSQRSYALRDIYQQADRDTSAVYVDLIGLGADSYMNADADIYYAGDRLHLSSEGYRYWYQAIRDRLKQAEMDLE